MSVEWQVLKVKRDAKWQEMKAVEDQVRLLNQEVELRRKQVSDLFNKHHLLMQEMQNIADQMLEIETESLIKAGV